MTTPTKISDHFYYHEFFSSGIWHNYDKALLRKLLDPRLIPLMEKIRTTLNKPIFVNNWKWGGNSMYRGFRPQNSSVGSLYSQHKFGRAVDFKVGSMTANEVREYILDNEHEYMVAGVTRLESGLDATTWVHVDFAWTGKDHIHVFRA